MPELPEVETTVRDLRDSLVGHTITGLTYADWPKMFITHPPEVVSQLIEGETVLAVTRRAKYIILELTNDRYFVLHRKMTGNLLWRRNDEAHHKFTRVIISFDNGYDLYFTDARKFGRVYLFLSNEELLSFFGKLGPEPLLDDFTLQIFEGIMMRRKGMLKPLLLNQSWVVGLGNIYANEALFVSGLHPARRAETLNAAEREKLYHAIRQVLETGIKNRGTTLSDYLDGNGRPGNNQEYLLVHFRDNKPCLNCGTPIVKITVAQRGTYLCPQCQIL